MGIIGKEQFPDSRIAFGGGGSLFKNACGNGASWSAENGDKNIKAFGYIFFSENMLSCSNEGKSCMQYGAMIMFLFQ